jgi:hypothetical protein
MTARSLPERVEAGPLTEAFRRTGVLGDGRVAEVAIERSFPTLLSHFFRLRLTYEGAATGAPASLIAKTGQLDSATWHGGEREVAFYTQVASATPAGLVPRCFGTHWDAATRAWHLLLEDLTDSHFVATQWPLPPTRDQCETIIRTRARFHAAWWDDPRLGVAIEKWEEAGAIDQNLRRLADQIARFVDDVGDQLGTERREFYARLLDAAPRLVARYHSHRHMTIVQGDAHVWNCFLPKAVGSNDARLFDWDAWRLGAGSSDLAYMMALHWYPDLRRRTERYLLDCYHDELLAGGVQGYDRHALEDDYRLSVLWQTTTPIWHHSARIPPIIWWNNLERIHLAVEDLGCRDLLAG